MAENLAVQHRLSQLKKLAALGKLVASVGHELNNPIMGILNYVQYCLRRTEEDDPRHSRLTKAVRELERCQRVLDTLRSHSYGSGGERGASGEWVDCRSLIVDTVDLLAPDFRQLGIELTIEAPKDLPPIWTDLGELHQILLNLLTNARDALADSEHKEITMRASADDDCLTIAVEDTGCGMSEKVLHRLFDPFFTTKSVGQGTGLGMSVCHNLAMALGAKIGVESQLDEGTIVTVRLPHVDQSAQPAERLTGTDG